jgi:predicted porin
LYLGVSFADATIYGNIDQVYQTSTTTANGVNTSKVTKMGSYQMGDSFLGFKGEEDLGGGMKASYLYEFGLKTETSATPTNRQSYVGLSGGFGALRIGRQYSSSFNNLVGADPLGATGGAGALYLGVNTSNVAGADSPLRQDKAIQYDLPTFAPGLKLTLTKVVAGADTAKTTDPTYRGGTKAGDSQGVAISYTTGALNVGYTTDSTKSQDINYSFGGITALTGAVAAANGSTTKQTTLAAGYDLGMAKISYSDAKVMNDGKGIKATLYGISVPVGAATLLATSSTGKLDLATDIKLKGMQYGVNYALSKRTVAYWHAGNATASQGADEAKVKGYGIGIHHSF